MKHLLNHYLKQVPEDSRHLAAISFLAALDHIAAHSPDIAHAIINELKAQRTHLKLIASENYSSYAVQLAMGNLLTDKYSEGYPGHRFYAGCENVDVVEQKAVGHLKEIFGCDHAYVQPHSGADANMVAFWSIIVQRVQNKEVEKLGKKALTDLTPEEYERVRQLLVNQKLLGMALNAGGHLTHGYWHNMSSKMMHAVSYDVDPKTHRLDYAEIEKIALREKPLIMTVGYSAYSRLIDFSKMKEIAQRAGATLMVDMAHFAGLVAGKVFKGVYSPVGYADIITSTTHKTMRGPRGGMVLCTKEFQETIDRGCPLVLGGPLPHVMAAKAIAFQEATQPNFALYAAQIVKNAQALAEEFNRLGVHVVTGGTDNHLMVCDVKKTYGLTGRQAETALLQAHLTLNRNTVPYDEEGAWYTSGIRVGTPALTTLGMREDQMKQVARLIDKLLRATQPAMVEKTGKPSLAQTVIDPKALAAVRAGVDELCQAFPLYPELIID